MRSPNEITQSELKGYLSYSPETGLFVWLNNMKYRIKAGDIAGSTRKDNGRVMIKINKVTYQAARLAYLYMTGSHVPKGLMIAYRDRNRTNLQWDNLVAVSRTTLNLSLTDVYKDTATGVRGVTRNGKRFVAREWNSKEKKNINIGTYATISLATEAKEAFDDKHRKF